MAGAQRSMNPQPQPGPNTNYGAAVSAPDRDQRPQGAAWINPLLRGVGELAVHWQQSATRPPHQAGPAAQPESPWVGRLARGVGELVQQQQQQPAAGVPRQPVPAPQQESAWMGQLARGMGELVMQQRQSSARPPHQPVSAHRQESDWAGRLARGVNEFAVQRQQAATRTQRQQVYTPGRAHVESWPEDVAWRGRSVAADPRAHVREPSRQATAASTPAQIPRPNPDEAVWESGSFEFPEDVIDTSALPPPYVSLNRLAEDASVLLELFGQSPHDDDDISEEHETMITTAATSILTMQARVRQRAARSNRDIASRQEAGANADCIICYLENADRVFLPCKHLVVCTVCIPPSTVSL